MLSLYIHLPFCDRQCDYCSFHVIALDQLNQERSPLIDSYVDALHQEIDDYASKLNTDNKEQIRTIYFGGGTPALIGAKRMQSLLDHIGEVFDLEYLEEVSIELNPEPQDQMLDFIKSMNSYGSKFLKLRYSIGIQSFDNQVLRDSGRQYTFGGAVTFLRQLSELIQDNVSFNTDFIAFGKRNQTRKGQDYLRSPSALDFFTIFLESGFADGLSLYTLELFEGSKRFHQLQHITNHQESGLGLHKYGNDDDIYNEFALLKDMILDAGYQRYEISNFSHAGKNSIHNRVYRSCQDYIGLGTSASSFVQNPQYLGRLFPDHTKYKAIRWTNTKGLKNYQQGKRFNHTETRFLTSSDVLIEESFLGLRMNEGIALTKELDHIFVRDWQSKLSLRSDQGLIQYSDSNLRLTDTGMDVYNSIMTELFQDF